MSYVIGLLYKNFKEETTTKSLLNLVFGVKKYITIIDSIDPYTASMIEHDMLQEFREYTLTLKQVIKKLKDDISRVEITTTMRPDTQAHVEGIIADLEESHFFSKQKSLRKVEQPKKIEKPSPLKEKSQMYQSVQKDFSFKGSESSSSKSSKPHSKQKYEEEKEQKFEHEKSGDSSDSESGFERKAPVQNRANPAARVQPQMIGIPKRF